MKRKTRKKKNKGGRPTKFTKATIAKLEKYFLLGCSDPEACLMADVSLARFYAFQKRTAGFKERKEMLKEKPTIIARESAVRHMKHDGHPQKPQRVWD